MPLLTSVAFGWPCRAQKAKPVLDWLMATAKTGRTPAFSHEREDVLGQPALVAVAAATLDSFFQPDTGKFKSLDTLVTASIWVISATCNNGVTGVRFLQRAVPC